MRKSGKNKAIAIKDPVALKRMQNYLKEHSYKAYILFMVGLGTGYRGGDLIKLTIEDLRKAIKTGTLVILEEKTENTRKVKFERVAYLNKKLIDILKEFVEGKSDSEYVYWSQKGDGKGSNRDKITREYLGKIFKKAAVECGIAQMSVGTHTPRKTYGYIQYIASGKDIYFVQELFGHSSPRITKAYIGIDEDMAKESSKNIDAFM